MATSETRASATCRGCGKTYRVPSRDRAYRCKECGGRVTADEDSAEDGVLPACAACDAVLPLGSRFCEECGTPVGDDARAEPEGGGEDRRAAALELNRAYRTIRRLRFFYTFFAVAAGFRTLVMLALLLGLAVLPTDRDVELREATWEVGLLFAFQLSVTGALVAGALRVAREPFVWGLAIAALQTLGVLVALVVPERSPGPVAYLFAVFFWGALPTTVRVRRLVERYPDLYVARRVRGERRRRPSEDGQTLQERHLERRRAESAARRRTFAVALAAVAAVLLGAFGLHAVLNRPPSLDDSADRFAAAWREGDVDAVAQLAAVEEREDFAGALRAELSLRGGAEGLPKGLGEPRVEERGDGARVLAFGSAGSELRSDWTLTGDGWVLERVVLPLGDLPSRFADAWNRGDVQSAAAYFGDPERAAGSLRRLVERRGWPSLPRFEPTELVEGSALRARHHGRTPEGPMYVTWRHRDGRWTVSSIKPPSGQE